MAEFCCLLGDKVFDRMYEEGVGNKALPRLVEGPDVAYLTLDLSSSRSLVPRVEIHLVNALSEQPMAAGGGQIPFQKALRPSCVFLQLLCLLQHSSNRFISGISRDSLLLCIEEIPVVLVKSRNKHKAPWLP